MTETAELLGPQTGPDRSSGTAGRFQAQIGRFDDPADRALIDALTR